MKAIRILILVFLGLNLTILPLISLSPFNFAMADVVKTVKRVNPDSEKDEENGNVKKNEENKEKVNKKVEQEKEEPVRKNKCCQKEVVKEKPVVVEKEKPVVVEKRTVVEREKTPVKTQENRNINTNENINRNTNVNEVQSTKIVPVVVQSTTPTASKTTAIGGGSEELPETGANYTPIITISSLLIAGGTFLVKKKLSKV